MHLTAKQVIFLNSLSYGAHQKKIFFLIINCNKSKNGSGPSQHYPCNNVPTLYASLVKIWKFQTVTPFVLHECISICVEEVWSKSGNFKL